MPNATLFVLVGQNSLIWTRRDGFLSGSVHILDPMEKAFRIDPSFETFSEEVNEYNDGSNPICEGCPEFTTQVFEPRAQDFDGDIFTINIDSIQKEYPSESIIIFNSLNEIVMLESTNEHLVGEEIKAKSIWWN